MRAFSRGALGVIGVLATLLLVGVPPAAGQAIECTADGNQDGVINVADLLALLADYGSSEAPYDTNGDGRVDVTDLLSLLSEFGKECLAVTEGGSGVPNPDDCNNWEMVWRENSGLQVMPGPDSGIPKSSNDVYYMSNADNDKGLYIYDPDPNYAGSHFWQSNSDSVRCMSSSQDSWSDELAGRLSCEATGVGDHACGTQNGWILWHNGATYMNNNHPCAVPGSTTPGAGDLTDLWICKPKVTGGWSEWTLASTDNLAPLTLDNPKQYKMVGDNGGYYITPITNLIWAWDSYQSVEGVYTYARSADGATDTFDCGHVETGHIGLGCSNGGGNSWKAFSWMPPGHAFRSALKPDDGQTQICQDQPDAFGVGACGVGTIYFRQLVGGETLGNELIDRATPDGAQRISFIDRTLIFPRDGRIISWDVFAGRAGEQRLQVWRQGGTDAASCVGGTNACSVSRAADGQTVWTLVCENVVTSPTAGEVEHFEVSSSSQCTFKAGDAIGWYHLGQGVTDFDGGGDDMIWNYPMDHPGIGGTVDFSGGNARTYSVAATVVYGAFGGCDSCGNHGYCVGEEQTCTCTGGWSGEACDQEPTIETLGNPVIDRTTPDGARDICFVDTDMKFTRAGRVVSWDYYVGRAGTQRMQIWRSTGNTDEFTLICENEVSTDSAGSVVHKEISDKEACFFEAGDMVGWYHEGQGVTDFDGGGHTMKWRYPMDHPGIGQTVAYSAGGSRTYSVQASVIYAAAMGNDLIDRSHPDGARRICFIDRTLVFPTRGKIMSWDVYAGRAGEQRLQVWRKGGAEAVGCSGQSNTGVADNGAGCSVSRAATGDTTWTLICENVVVAENANEVSHFVLPSALQCTFEAGDAIGWYHLEQGVTDYDNGGNDVIWNYPMDHPGRGGTVTFSGGNSRTYSVGATVVYGDFPTFCPTDFIYDAGVSYNPINCLTGAVGLEEVQLDANHQYPDVPFGDCPPNPGKTQGATNHGGATGAQGDNPAVGWIEANPTNSAHYFANAISGDTGGYNAWGVQDDTSDGGQYHGFSLNIDQDVNAAAFQSGWVSTTRAKLVSGTGPSTYLLAYLGTSTFRYLPYIYFDGDGQITVREYGNDPAVLPIADFDPEEYHLYELVYDPLLADQPGCAERSFAANCAARLYVDGTDQGVYYPYRFPGTVDSTAALQWGSGSSGGQAFLRYNLVHWAPLTSCNRKPYFLDGSSGR